MWCHFHNVTLSTIFRWGGYFSHMFKNFFLLKYYDKFLKKIEIFQCYHTNVLRPFYGSQCACNSYNSYRRYTRTVKMLYFHNNFQHMQKSATYSAKSFQLLRGGLRPQTLWPGALPLDPDGGTAPDPIIWPPILAISPQTQGVWIKPCA